MAGLADDGELEVNVSTKLSRTPAPYGQLCEMERKSDSARKLHEFNFLLGALVFLLSSLVFQRKKGKKFENIF